MEDNAIALVLSDGSEVELVETWVIDDETNDSYPEVEIYECDTHKLIGCYRGTLPDTEEEDFDGIVALIEKVEQNIN